MKRDKTINNNIINIHKIGFKESTNAVKLLEAILKEEKAADERLSEVATDASNLKAAREEA